MEITIKLGNKYAEYDAKKGEVESKTSEGNIMIIQIPNNWGATRIFQFMEKLLKSEI